MSWMLPKAVISSLSVMNGLIIKLIEQNDTYTVSARSTVLAKGRTADLPEIVHAVDVDLKTPVTTVYASIIVAVKHIRAHVSNDLELAIVADVDKDQAYFTLRGDLSTTQHIPLSSIWQAVLDRQSGLITTLFDDLSAQLVADYSRISHFRWYGLEEDQIDYGALRDMLQSRVKGLRVGVATDPSSVILSIFGEDLMAQERVSRIELASIYNHDVTLAGAVERLIVKYGKAKYWRN